MTQEPFTETYPVPVGSEPQATRPIDDLSAQPPSSGSSTKDVATEQASQLGHGAAEAGKQVAGTAKEQAADVAGEARAQARNVLGQAQTEVRDQADGQKQRVAEGLHSIGHELDSMAERSEQPGMATDLARQASQVAHDAASWLEQRDPVDLLGEIRGFARRRPGAFLGIALGAGVLAGRLTRGATPSSSSTSSGGSSGSGTGGSSSGNGASDTPYSAPAYGTTAAGATYATPEVEPVTEYPSTDDPSGYPTADSPATRGQL
jgi:hypothetical protein